jgi:hypothetical protein
MNLYSFEQDAQGKLPDYTDADILKAKRRVQDFLSSNPSQYYMMLCNEERYYTLYTFTGYYKFAEMAEEIIDIASHIGAIKDVSISDEHDAMLFWIVPDGDDLPHLYALFDYTQGVVEI